jgi:hypothetical protein
MLLLLAAALPVLYWDGAADTAPALREAGIQQIQAPPERIAAWQSVAGIAAEAMDPASAVKLLTPAVNYRANQATASREPWIDSNGWRFLRQPQARFYYDAADKAAAIAAAEASMYGVKASIKTDSTGLQPLAQMLAFLRALPDDEMPPVADIAYIDDGSPASGEVINLLVRGNLLLKLVQSPDRNAKLTVRFGSKEYPAEDAKNPKMMAQQIRTNLTDERRSLRIYGTATVVGRLNGSGGRLRLQLLNYAGAARRVDGLRVRVSGNFPNHKLTAAGGASGELLDYTLQPDATEFTLRELQTYAVIDLSR